MESIYFLLAFWFLAAIVSAVLARHLKVSVALMEIIVGSVIGYGAYKLGYFEDLNLQADWMKILTGLGAILLTFLAGAELEPATMKTKLKEVSVVGFIGFFAPFIGCALVAYYLIGWDLNASLLCGIALSTTSMAVVYAVMLETGFNKTSFGKGILGSCFINDLGTVIGLGLIFAPFTLRTLVFLAVIILLIFLLPLITRLIIKQYANRTAAIRAKWLLFVLVSMGVLALWSGSEPVLPAYIIGMLLANTMEKDLHFVRRIRTMTVGLLTPLYFLRAGALVSIPAIATAPLVFLLLLAGKVVSKIFGLFPVIGLFRKNNSERWYYTLMMSTGLTFGTISALYGFTHGIVDQAQYSFLVAAVIGSAVIPTLIANLAFMPRHLIPQPETSTAERGSRKD